MKFIKPKTITDTEFTSSTVAENDFAEWASGTTYADGDKVIMVSTHRIYESVAGGNTGNNPSTDDGTWWIDIGPTNRWAMFDSTVGTLTSNATSIVVVLTPAIVCNAIALLDLTADSVRVQMIDGAATVYDTTYAMYDSAQVTDWYDYFFEEIQPQTTLIVDDLPAYKSASITITITSSTTAVCGTLSVGQMIDIGGTYYGAQVGIIDYSVKDTDVFGVTTVLQRSYAKTIDVDCMIDNARLDYIHKKLADVRATPCVWIGDDRGIYDSTIIFGFYKDWESVIAYPNFSQMRLTVEGLT